MALRMRGPFGIDQGTIGLLRRRSFIGGIIGAAALPGAALATPAMPREARRLAVQFAHTGAWFRGPYSGPRGYDPAAIADFSEVCGDWRARESRPFDPALLDQLWQLGRRVGVGQFACVSGYRSARTNALVGGAADSQHLQAKAVDIWLGRDKLGEAIEAAKAMKAGGVGAYATWIHLDTGAVRTWDRRSGEGDGEVSMPRVASGAAPFVRGRSWMILEPLERQNGVANPFFTPPRVLNLR